MHRPARSQDQRLAGPRIGRAEHPHCTADGTIRDERARGDHATGTRAQHAPVGEAIYARKNHAPMVGRIRALPHVKDARILRF